MKTPQLSDPLITRKGLAENLSVNQSTLWRWCQTGYLPQPVRLGGRTGWPRSVINAWKIDQGWPEEGEAA